MKLTLAKLHRIMGQVIGAEAVTLQNFCTRVEEDSITCGIMLGADGVLYYDPDWWDANIDTPEKAKHVVFAEIMKHVLGVQYHNPDWISKVAAGAVINAYLFHAFGYHELPRAMYSAKDLPECLMRPNARGYHSRLKRIYRGIWDREARFTNISNVEQALRILFLDTSLIPQGLDPNDIQVPGFGQGGGEAGEGEGEGEEGEEGTPGQSKGKGNYAHGFEGAGEQQVIKTKSDRLPPSLVEHMSNGVKEACQSAGYSNVMGDFVVERMNSNKSLKTILVEDFVLDTIKKKIRKTFEPDEPEQSMLPLKLTKRDAFKLAMGWTPIFFEQETEKEVEDGDGGLAIYMDVSGSFYSFIPYTLGVIQCVEDMVEKIYQFSNMVAEIPFNDIKGNKVRINSTGGTDFDCVLAHAIEHNYDKVLIITDGWADVNNPKIREEADKKISKVLVLMVTQLPGGSHYVRGNEVTGVTSGDPFYMANKEILDMFLTKTWLGQRYNSACMLSDAFKDKT
jgi:hypothetical protein